jgi:hypothetical protein
VKLAFVIMSKGSARKGRAAGSPPKARTGITAAARQACPKRSRLRLESGLSVVFLITAIRYVF